MSYLLDLVKSLSSEELKQLKSIDLIGKEELIRDAYANYTSVKDFNEASLPKKFQLSQSHFDKINSVLLAKAIQQLYGEDYNNVFVSIQNKGLIELLFHQLKINEKRILKVANPLQTKAFYRSAFDILRSMFHPSYSSKLTHEFGKKYLQSLGFDKTIDDEAYVEMLALYGDILEARFAGNETAFKPTAQNTLDKWEKKIASNYSAVAKCFYGFAKATFFKHFTDDVQSYVTINEIALHAYYDTQGKVEKKYEGVLLSETAFGYIATDRHAEALKLYDKVMSEFDETLGKHIYHQTVYFAASVICRDYVKSHQIFDKYLKPRLRPDTFKNIIFEVCALGLCLALHEKDFAAADHWFTQLTSIQTKDVTPIGRVMIRLYESAYFYFSGDEKTALKLTEKHLDYLKRQGNLESTYDFQYRFIDCINKLVKYKSGTLRSVANLEKSIGELQTGIYSLQNMLLLDEWQNLRAQS